MFSLKKVPYTTSYKHYGHGQKTFTLIHFKEHYNNSYYNYSYYYYYYYYCSQFNPITFTYKLPFSNDNIKVSHHLCAFDERRTDLNPLQFIIDSFDISNDNSLEKTSPPKKSFKSSQDKEDKINLRFQKYLSKSKWKDASICFEKLLKYNNTIPTPNAIPSKSKINTLLFGLSNSNAFYKSYKIYMSLSNEQKTTITYKTMISLLKTGIKNKFSNHVIRLFKEFRKNGFKPDLKCYSFVINGLAKEKRKGQSSASFFSYKLWNELKNSPHISLSLDDAAMRAGCSACVAMGKMEEAENLITIMKKMEIQPDVRMYNIIIKGYCKAFDMKGAMSFFERMKENKIDATIITYNTLVNGFISNGESHKAHAMIKEALKLGYSLDIWTYASLIKGYVKEKKMKNALNLHKSLIKNGFEHNIVIYGTLINGFIEIGDMLSAHTYVKIAQNHNLKINNVIYNTLLKGYAKHLKNHIDDIQNLLLEMANNDIFPQTDTINILLKQTLELKGIAITHKLYKMISKEFTDGMSSATLMQGYNQKNLNNKLENIFYHGINDDEKDLVHLNMMVASFAKQGDLDTAENFINKALDYAKSKGLPIPIEAYGALIKECINKNDLKRAISLFRHFYKNGGHPDIIMFESLLRVCLINGDMNHAFKFLRAMKLSNQTMNIEKYQKWFKQYEDNRNSIKNTNNQNIEKVKFWLGLPNSLYSSDWP